MIADPQHELRLGMFATFVIQLDEVRSVAAPQNGVIREGDGTLTVWVASDQESVTRRTVKAGLQREGFVQIHKGLKSAQPVAPESFLFLSSALQEVAQ